MRQRIRSRRPIKAPTGAFPPNKSAGLSASRCLFIDLFYIRAIQEATGASVIPRDVAIPIIRSCSVFCTLYSSSTYTYTYLFAILVFCVSLMQCYESTGVVLLFALFVFLLPVVALGYNPVLQVIASPIVCLCSNTLCISSLLLLAADGGATGGHPNVGNPGNPRVFFDITIGKQPAGRIVFEVFRQCVN